MPWKYLEATIFVAVIDQLFGTSTFFCSKMTSPDSLVIAAVRYSHSTLSYGEIPSRVKYRRNSKPLLGLGQMPVPVGCSLQDFLFHWTLPPFFRCNASILLNECAVFVKQYLVGI